MKSLGVHLRDETQRSAGRVAERSSQQRYAVAPRQRHSKSSKLVTPTAAVKFRSLGPWRSTQSKPSTSDSPVWANRESRRAVQFPFAARSQMLEYICKIGPRPGVARS